MSFLIRGVVKGIKVVNNRDREGNVYSKTFVGIESPKAGGYQGEVIITDVQVSKDQLASGLPAYYEKVVGQEIMAPVFIMPWKNGGNYTVFFEGQGHCKAVGDKKAA